MIVNTSRQCFAYKSSLISSSLRILIVISEASGFAVETIQELLEMALARIRQLSCHEVGHTLGLGHNYASSVNDRASVMDYPHPLIKIGADGALDLSDAYDVGVGEWDTVSIAFGYQHFPDGVDEEKELKAILDGVFSRGLYFLAGQDAGISSAHPDGCRPREPAV